MNADILRKKFLEFFKNKDHKIVSSDSLIPRDDPTVLFTPAGMNQFKKEFILPNPDLKRAATSQRCLRTDDLEKVGKTSGHHTFFEMLGNFSFGDYFKKEAILYAWEFLTQDLKIDKEKLWVSVYRDDAESFNIWKDEIKLPEAKIVKLGDKENFWPSEAKSKGPNGPCGPCSEIFFDQGPKAGCQKPGCDPACDCDRFVEVWNLVFTQFNRTQDGQLEALPKKNIDTGMGLERLTAIMQKVHNNFETDLFRPLVREIINGLKKHDPKDKGIIYALADHLRAIVFAIYDGVMPANESRGYVAKKLIRKCVLYLRSLGVEKPFLYKLVPILSQIMHKAYPELTERRENIAEIILAEEKSFISTLESSDTILNKLKDSGLKGISEIAFVAYDTHGIPAEISWDYFIKQGINVSVNDKAEFNSKLEEQILRSKSQSAISKNVFDIKDLGLDVKSTDFIGYKEFQCRSKILKIFRNNQCVKNIAQGEQAEIILDKTVFYPESGGQIGDKGEFKNGKNIFEVNDTKKINDVIIHRGKVKEGNFAEADELSAVIDNHRRLAIARNHTATHLLQAALRKVLGEHVQQQGSLVAEDRLRFDFTHFKDVTKDELDRIEEEVNEYILNNHLLKAKEMRLSEAKKAGALAFFGEKYDEKVRVVSIGDFSKELCAGSHLGCTGQIGLFKITQESSVASGVRRIEAQTGTFAYRTIKKQQETLDQVSSALSAPYERISDEVNRKLKKIKELEKQLNILKFDQIKIDDFINQAQIVKGIRLIRCNIDGVDMGILRKIVDSIKQKEKNNTITVAASRNSEQVYLVLGITEDLCNQGIDAAKLIKEIAQDVGGSGGGRRDFAQAGGNQPQNLDQAICKLKEILP